MSSAPQIDKMISRLEDLRETGKHLSRKKQDRLTVEVLEILGMSLRIIEGQASSMERVSNSRRRAWVRVKAHEARTAAALRLRPHLVPDVDGSDVLVIRSTSLSDVLLSPLHTWNGQPSLAEVEAKDD